MRLADPVHNVAAADGRLGRIRWWCSPSLQGRDRRRGRAASPAGASTGTRASGGRPPTTHRALRQGRPRALPRASASSEAERWLVGRGPRLGRAGDRRPPRRRGLVRRRDDLRRAAPSCSPPARSSAGTGCGCPSAARWPTRCSSSARRPARRPRGPLRRRSCRSASRRRPPRSPSVSGVAEPRFGLDVNWDPSTRRRVPAAAGGRGARADPARGRLPDRAARALHAPSTGSRSSANARAALEVIRAEHDEAVEAIRRSRARTGPPLDEVEPRLGGTLSPSSAAGVAYLLDARRAFLADEQGLGKTVAGARRARGRRRVPRRRRLPRVAQAQLGAGDRALAAPPQRSTVLAARARAARRRRHRHPQLRDRPRPPRAPAAAAAPQALVLDEAHYCKNPRAKRTQATRKLADGLRARLAQARAVGHARAQPRRTSSISQLRIIGRLERLRLGRPASRAASAASAPRSASTGTCGGAASCGG